MQKYNNLPSYLIVFAILTSGLFLQLQDVVSLRFSHDPAGPGLIYNHMLAGSYNFQVISYTVLTIAIITSLGFFALNAFEAYKDINTAPKLIFAFIPGSLIYISITRIITLFFTINHSIYITTVIGTLIFFYAIYKAIISPHRNVGEGAFYLKISVPVIILFLLFSIKYGAIHVTGDASNIYFEIFKNSKSSGLETGYLPILPIHYDELMLLFLPIGLSQNVAETHWIQSLWLIMAYTRFSVFIGLIYHISTYLKKDSVSFLIAAFLMLGTSSINPFAGGMMFDAGNPLAFSMHFGRMIPTVLILFALHIAHKEPHFGHSKALVLLIIAMGLTSLSAHVAIILAPFILFLVLCDPDKIRLTPKIYGLLLAVISISFFGSVAYYGSYWEYGFYIISGGLLLYSAIFISKTYNSIAYPGNFATIYLVVAAGILFFSYLYLGNIFSNPPPDVMAIMESARGRLMTSGNSTIPLFQLNGNSQFASPVQSCDQYKYLPCSGITTAAGLYGLPFVLAIIYSVLATKSRKEAEGPFLFNIYSAVSLAFIVSGVVLTFWFTPDNQTDYLFAIILKTRFIEIFYYIALIMPIIGIYKLENLKFSKYLTVFLITWTIIPLIHTQAPIQLYNNAKYLLTAF